MPTQQGGVERLHQWEAKNDVEFAVAVAEGSDPAAIRSSRDAPRTCGRQSQMRSLLPVGASTACSHRQHSTHPEGRVRAAEAAMKIINSSPNALLRDQYAGLVADRCSISPEKLRPTRSVAEPAPKASGPS